MQFSVTSATTDRLPLQNGAGAPEHDGSSVTGERHVCVTGHRERHQAAARAAHAT